MYFKNGYFYKNSNKIISFENFNTIFFTKYEWNVDMKNVLRPSNYEQGIAGSDNWIAQSRLQSNLVGWIVIDNPKSSFDFGSNCTISIQILKAQFVLRNLKFHCALCFNRKKAKLI
jgi:hypothetical protein